MIVKTIGIQNNYDKVDDTIITQITSGMKE